MATALALRYARAFAEVAESAKLDSSAAQSQLRDFAETLAGSSDLRELLENPSIEQASKLKVLDAIAKRMGMFAQVRNFLAVIIEHGRLAELNDILKEYREMADADSGAVEARIVTARPLNDADRAQLEAQVTRMAGAHVRATYAQDASLIGGAVVEIGSTIYDGSVRTQLQQLKQRLVNA
ncbi:MAG TPA: ATP synthase F1 subunit delta [Acidobacteriaceae bacterium]|nr:ATP synthase F1 subunit delta [Acidobacteriaceae bacterium]